MPIIRRREHREDEHRKDRAPRPGADGAKGKALAGRIKDARGKYVVSFGKVGKLLDEGRREEAIALLNTETLPALDALQEPISEAIAFQGKLVKKRQDDISAGITSATNAMVLFGLLALLVGVVVSVMVARGLTVQLGGEPEYASQIISVVTAGDLTAVVEVKPGDRTSLLFMMKNMVERLARTVGEVRVATAQSLSQGTSEQAASVEETTSSLEQMSASITQSAENSRQSEQIASKGARDAEESGRQCARRWTR